MLEFNKVEDIEKYIKEKGKLPGDIFKYQDEAYLNSYYDEAGRLLIYDNENNDCNEEDECISICHVDRYKDMKSVTNVCYSVQ